MTLTLLLAFFLCLVTRLFCTQINLSQACREGDLALVQALLANPSINVNWIPESMDTGYRPALIEAIIGGHLDAVHLLLAHGADPNLPYDDTANKQGWRPISYAVDTGSMAIFTALALHGFDPDITWSLARNANFHLTNTVWSARPSMQPEGFAALVAMQVRRIREGSVLVDARSSVDSYRLLDRVVLFGTIEQIRLVHSLGADPNTGFTNVKVSYSPRGVRSTELTTILPPLAALCKYPALHNPAKLAALLELGAHIDGSLEGESRKNGRGALWYACHNLGRQEVCWLLQRGASPEQMDSLGNNMLAVCLNSKNTQCAVELLVAMYRRHGSVKDMIMHTNDSTHSALDIAVNSSNHHALRLFLLLGASITKEPAQYQAVTMASLAHILAKEFGNLRKNAVRFLALMNREDEDNDLLLPTDLSRYITSLVIEIALRILE